MARSCVSRTTTGGCTFEMLCTPDSVPSYACDNLIDLTEGGGERHPLSLNRATEALIKHVKDCITSIEIGQERKVAEFYIGKTHVDCKLRRTFNHMDRSTWRLEGGINNRYRFHRRKNYGKDGLVVLTVVTEEAIPHSAHTNREKVTQELYALALESRLIQHFLIECGDPRIVNISFDAGGKDDNRSQGYPLYMAYTLKEGDSASVWEDSSWDDSANYDGACLDNLFHHEERLNTPLNMAGEGSNSLLEGGGIYTRHSSTVITISTTDTYEEDVLISTSESVTIIDERAGPITRSRSRNSEDSTDVIIIQ